MKTGFLHHGELSFSTLEEGEGPVALCLHGFPDHARSFRFQLPALAEAGFRAISPTMRGYEPSSQPRDGDYQLLRMAEDVAAWIEELEAPRIHLIGHDWGAVVSYLVAAMIPDRLKSLSTIAIASPGRMQSDLWKKRPSQLRKSWYMFFFQLRGFADYVVEKNDWAFIENRWRDWSPGWELPADELLAIKKTLSAPGVKHAALGYYRAIFNPIPVAWREASRLFAHKVSVPTLAITGALDGCMDTRLHDDLMNEADFLGGLEVKRIDGAGHFVHQEKPEEVNRVLLDWLAKHD